MKCVDLIGKKFGKLTVISREQNDRWGQSTWLCQCDCGQYKRFRRSLLSRPKHTKSCGCIKKQTGPTSYKFKGYGEIGKRYWSNVLRNAAARKWVVRVSIQQAWELFLKQNKKCALTGLPLKFDSNVWSRDGNASLDRINSSLPYDIENIQWVDKRVNNMKQALPQKEFIQLCMLIVQHNNS